jgi:hypothetical protein
MIAFRKEVFNREMKIGEGMVKSSNPLSLALAAKRGRGRRNIAPVVGREQFIQRCSILLIPDDFDVTTHESFVLFG